MTERRRGTTMRAGIFCPITVLTVLCSSILVSGKGLMLLEESRGQTLAYPLENVATTPIEEHVLDILELEEPPPPISLRKRSEKVANFMSQLYHELEKGSESVISNAPSNRDEWSTADRIVSFSPAETKLSEGLVATMYDCEDLPSSMNSHLVAAQLRIFLPEHVAFAKISIYTNSSGTLSLIDSTIATSREKTVSFNVTHLVSDWIQGVSEPKVYISLDGGIDSPYLFKSELESFIIAFFVDGSPNIPYRNTRSKRAVEPAAEPAATVKVTERAKTIHS
ncbi:hypothetical protein ANCDUO_15378 [Ancylostoma duodenale]|uniref:TGF-beta propeptide domain-containing protein n=1 Tax=Ancylostoma duodenale TaxID=51022 RepID=A0A0C2G0P4_9BILA|nr:hypothetical protein ANCDUO_15378 [Ancylostoma duodenale]